MNTGRVVARGTAVCACGATSGVILPLRWSNTHEIYLVAGLPEPDPVGGWVFRAGSRGVEATCPECALKRGAEKP